MFNSWASCRVGIEYKARMTTRSGSGEKTKETSDVARPPGTILRTGERIMQARRLGKKKGGKQITEEREQ